MPILKKGRPSNLDFDSVPLLLIGSGAGKEGRRMTAGTLEQGGGGEKKWPDRRDQKKLPAEPRD